MLLLRSLKRTPNYYGIKSDVVFYSIIDWMEMYYGSEYPRYDDRMKKLEKWCDTHNVYYYAAPREFFNYNEAVRQTNADNKTRCLLEDLS